ncbi:MAG: prolyl oligopeptidase family serine peptidase [Mariniblastus sp.]
MKFSSCFVLIMLAACAISGRPAVAQSSEGQPGQQIEAVFESSDGAKVPYLIYLPKNYSTESDQEFALLYFLHGRGESNGPLSLVAKWGPPKFAARGDDLPYIIVSPQCPRSDRWSSDTQQKRLTELLDAITNRYRVNEDSIFLTGLSMGGYGTWTMATNSPARFAAVAPICGGGDPAKAANLVDVPIWVFHGDQDKPVPFEKSVKMVDAIKEAGGTQVRFTTMENVGHNCWSAAYATPELYQWMRAQVKD